MLYFHNKHGTWQGENPDLETLTNHSVESLVSLAEQLSGMSGESLEQRGIR